MAVSRQSWPISLTEKKGIMRSFIVIAALMSLAVSAYAQTSAEKDQASREWLQKVFGMPGRADEIRKTGVPESEVRSIFDVLAGRNLPPQEVDEILVAHRDAAREHGPTDNFGAFVQSQLDKGLRGRELAAAIKAEHVARGKGKYKEKDKDKDKAKAKVDGKVDGNRGRSDEASKGNRPDDAGSAARGKRADSASAARTKRPNN